VSLSVAQANVPRNSGPLACLTSADPSPCAWSAAAPLLTANHLAMNLKQGVNRDCQARIRLGLGSPSGGIRRASHNQSTTR